MRHQSKRLTLSELIGAKGLISDGDWIESKDQDPEGDVRLVQLADIGDGSFIDKSSRFLTSKRAGELRCTYLKKGDLLIARMPDPIGRACVFPGGQRPSVTAVDVCIVRPGGDIVDTNWLKHAFNSQLIRREIEKGATGTTRSRIATGKLKVLEFNVPTLAEQNRIAAILDKADSLRRKRQEAIQLADDFLRTVFLDMFGDPVTNPKGWRDDLVLGDVAELVSGITKGRKLPTTGVREVSYLAVSNVQDRHLKLGAVKTIDASEDEIARYRLRRDDLLLTEGGDPDKLGRGTLWRDELPECIHQNHIFRVRISSAEVSPIFLNWLVGSKRGKQYFLNSAKQTTGIASINMRQLKAFPLLLPPRALQDKFASVVLHMASLTEKHASSLASMESLPASLAYFQ